MKNLLAIFLAGMLFSCNKDTTPLDDCYTCKTELTIERPNQAAEQSTNTEKVCSETVMEEYKRKNTYEETTITQRTKSVATCIR